MKFKSQILSLYFEIMMICLKKYKQTQVFNIYDNKISHWILETQILVF